MASFVKDSAILEILATQNGYMVRLWQWSISPPPIPHRNLDNTEIPTEFRLDRIATNKANLITDFTNWLNNSFDT